MKRKKIRKEIGGRRRKDIVQNEGLTSMLKERKRKKKRVENTKRRPAPEKTRAIVSGVRRRD